MILYRFLEYLRKYWKYTYSLVCNYFLKYMLSPCIHAWYWLILNSLEIFLYQQIHRNKCIFLSSFVILYLNEKSIFSLWLKTWFTHCATEFLGGNHHFIGKYLLSYRSFSPAGKKNQGDVYSRFKMNTPTWCCWRHSNVYYTSLNKFCISLQCLDWWLQTSLIPLVHEFSFCWSFSLSQ